MALPATIHRFQIELSDVDGGHYDALDIRVARHPSESVPYLLTRVVAWALHAGDGAAMSPGGLAEPSDPAIEVRDLTGRRTLWLDIGNPAPERLHRASKAVERVAVYTYKDPQLLTAAIARFGVHRADAIEIRSLPADFLEALGETLVRNNAWSLVRTDGELYVTVDGATLSAALGSHRA